MRFGISATSLMCPKNLRTRLRPVNVCCAIVASHFVAPEGRTFPKRDCHRPRVEFRHSSFAQLALSVRTEILNRSIRTLKNAKRRTGRSERTRPSKTVSSRTAKARNCLSPNGLRRNLAVPAASRAFVLPPRYGMAIVEIRGVTPPIPTHSRVHPCPAGRA